MPNERGGAYTLRIERRFLVGNCGDLATPLHTTPAFRPLTAPRIEPLDDEGAVSIAIMAPSLPAAKCIIGSVFK
jgi:hypothetical protein